MNYFLKGGILEGFPKVIFHFFIFYPKISCIFYDIAFV
ncbi:hypothetical protein SAMN05444369_102203 [Capnocytophaga haemolytica]|uniref:Uncharacterized protein n=1 Tax=Capnocytophaga haemolytica TaxID=45243 RepID=A0AAX2GWC8_9FLAO|nr:hypothetical protein SAMN05444369_102203 [Capnocytophaga haemolytica]SNV06626.1 Uncharacterised protein [Capnocytophaga haemolytica]